MSSSRLCHLNEDLLWFSDIYFQGRSTPWKHTIEAKYAVFFFFKLFAFGINEQLMDILSVLI